MADVVVVGAGLVGQLTALLLARAGHQVRLLDADDEPALGDPDADFVDWQRAGIPQAGHGHVFRGRAGRVLRDRAPDVVDAMLTHGIRRAGFDFGPGYEDDFALLARRPVLEAVLRRCVRLEPGVEVLTGTHVDGLAATSDAIPRVVGVRTGLGEQIAAELVVDCSGRRSMAPRWLDAIGARLAVDDYQQCELHYFARHYRLRPGCELPSTTFPDDAEGTPYGIFLAVGQDNRTFCLAGALAKSDPLRGRFRDGEVFDRVLGALPGPRRWLEAGTPETEVMLMGGLANRRRTLVSDDRPAVSGYVLVGDASLYTNATFGQGAALGFWQASALADRSGLIGGDHVQLVRELEAWTDRVLGPLYRAQVAVDIAMIDAMKAGIEGAPMMSTRDPQIALAILGAQGDQEAAAAFYRIDNLLDTVADVLRDDDLRRRVDAQLATVEEGPAGPGPLPRAEFEALVR